MLVPKTLRHVAHPFGRQRLICRFIKLSDLHQLLWLFGLVLMLNAVVLASGVGVFFLVA